MNLAVVLEMTPLTFEDNVNELVEVEIVKLLLFIIVPVAIEPPMLEVKIFPNDVKKFETYKLFTDRFDVNRFVEVAFVMVALPAFKFKILAIEDQIFVENKFVEVELLVVALVNVARNEVRLLNAAESELSKLVTILLAEILVVVEFVIVAEPRLARLEKRFEDCKLVIVAFENVALLEIIFCEFKVVALEVIKLEVEAFVVEALEVKKFEVFPKITAIFADKAEIALEITELKFAKLENKLVEVELVFVELFEVKLWVLVVEEFIFTMFALATVLVPKLI